MSGYVWHGAKEDRYWASYLPAVHSRGRGPGWFVMKRVGVCGEPITLSLTEDEARMKAAEMNAKDPVYPAGAPARSWAEHLAEYGPK